MADATIVQGGTFTFTVVAKNRLGTVIPVTDAAVALADPSLGSVTLNGDGTAGVFTSSGAVGSEVLTPSAGGTTGTPFALDVQADTAVASVTIVPDAPASVTVQPS